MHHRTAVVLANAGIATVRQLVELTPDQLAAAGVGRNSATDLSSRLEKLLTLPAHKLRGIGRFDPDRGFVLPGLSLQILTELSYAKSVDAEILAIAADKNARNSDVVLARWQFDISRGETLESIGDSFGITRERTRQIVQAKENSLMDAGVRLPLATVIVEDLTAAGSALPDADFRTLLKYSQVEVSEACMRALPDLSRLGCVPYIQYHPEFDLWTGTSGRLRWIDSGRARDLRSNVRRTVGTHLRLQSAVSVRVIEPLSPWGTDHAARLAAPVESAPVRLGAFISYDPPSDSILLRVVRKTLAVTTRMRLSELHAGLVHHKRFPDLDEPVMRAVLERSGEFVMDGDSIAPFNLIRRGDVLSRAELAGVELLEQHAGIMMVRDFIDGMVARGFSVPMASVVLRRPFVKAAGPATYRLRGREVSEEMRDFMRRRRSQVRKGQIVKIVADEGSRNVVVMYRIGGWALQGVLTAVKQLRTSPRQWTAILPDGRETRINIANGFVWSFKDFFKHAGITEGMLIEARFDLATQRVNVRAIQPPESRPVSSHNERILRALFHEQD